MSITEFKKIFSERHILDGEDVQVLKSKYPGTNFVNIPDSWVLGLDVLMRKAGPGSIVAVYQRNGFLGVSVREGRENDILIDAIEHTSAQLATLDADLHQELNG